MTPVAVEANYWHLFYPANWVSAILVVLYIRAMEKGSSRGSGATHPLKPRITNIKLDDDGATLQRAAVSKDPFP